jgi:hypothetical protein
MKNTKIKAGGGSYIKTITNNIGWDYLSWSYEQQAYTHFVRVWLNQGVELPLQTKSPN